MQNRSKVTAEQATKFIAGLELPSGAELKLPSIAAQPRILAAIDPNQPSAAVVAGATTSFVAGVSKQHREDVENSVLLAQLAANKQYDRETDTQNWYTFYHDVLENVGWIVPDFNFDQYQASGDTFTVDKIILDILQAAVSGDELAVVQKTIDALKSLDKGDGRVVLYDRQTHSDHQGNFQAHSVSESDGIAVMNIGTFYFSAQDTVTQILWFTFPTSRSSFYQGAQNMNLDDGVYSKVRQAIKDKLGSNAVDFVKDLQI